MNKRGVSEIVSYVLLVIIAVSISVFVFAFLKLYVPKEKPECKEGINLIIESADCKYNQVTNEAKLKLKVQNRGRFNIGASYIRIGKIGRTYRENVVSDIIFNPPLEPGKTIFAHDSENQPIGFDVVKFGTPDATTPPNYQLILEVQPGFLTGRGVDSLALCNKISQTITCTPT